MKKIALLGVLFMFSLSSFAQETKVIKDGNKVSKEQVVANKKKFDEKIKAAQKKATISKKSHDKSVKDAKVEISKDKNEVKSKALTKKTADKVTGTNNRKKVYTGPKGGK